MPAKMHPGINCMKVELKDVCYQLKPDLNTFQFFLTAPRSKIWTHNLLDKCSTPELHPSFNSPKGFNFTQLYSPWSIGYSPSHLRNLPLFRLTPHSTVKETESQRLWHLPKVSWVCCWWRGTISPAFWATIPSKCTTLPPLTLADRTYLLLCLGIFMIQF